MAHNQPYLVRKARMIWAEGKEIPVDLHAKLVAEGHDVAHLERLYRD